MGYLKVRKNYKNNDNSFIISGGRIIRRFAVLIFVVALFFVTVSTTTISCLASNQTVSAMDLTYLTEQYPPYNFQEDGRLQGISVDLLEKMWERIGVNLNRSTVKLLPWTEGYEKTLKENNTVLFTAFRLPEREKLFKWVGPVASGRDVLLAKNDKNFSITAPGDLKQYKIAAIKDDVATQRLLNYGVEKDDLIIETSSKPIIEMLENGTIDAWAYNELAGLWLIQQSGANASDYKVAYVLAQGDGYYAFNKGTPDSLVQSFQQALDYIKSNKDKEGITDYQKILYKYVPHGSLVAAESETSIPFMLLQIQADVQGNLTDLDSDVANAAQKLSATGIDGAAARGVLRKLLETNSNLVEAATVSKDGKIILAECKGCAGGEGADISHQEHIAHILKNKTPAFSKNFMLVEGYNGTALAYPVFSPQGEFLGGISTIIEPDKLLNAMVAPQLHFNISTRSNITDYSFWMLTPDGLVAYDRDESQIGKDLFEDPLYRPFPSLLDLGKRIIAERSGHGNYSFQVTEANKKVVTKDTYWTTVELHGREWRLVVTKIME